MKKLLALTLVLAFAGTCLIAQDAPPAEPPQDAEPQADVAAPPARRQLTPEQIQERHARRFPYVVNMAVLKIQEGLCLESLLV